MTEFDLSERDFNDGIEDVRQAFREWAERNNFDLFEDSPNEGWLMAKINDYREVRMDNYGNIELSQRARITLEDGSIKFTDSSLVGKTAAGPDLRVSDSSFPVWRSQ